MEVKLDPLACNNGDKQNLEDITVYSNCNNMIILNDTKSCYEQELLRKENVTKNYPEPANEYFVATTTDSSKNEPLTGMENKDHEYMYEVNRLHDELDVESPNNNDIPEELLETKCFNRNKQKRYELRKRKESSLYGNYPYNMGTEIKQVTNIEASYENMNDKTTFSSHCKNLCEYSNSELCNKDAYNIHTEVYNNQSYNMEKCMKCSTLFLTNSGMQCHVCSKDKITFKCDKCNRIFNDEEELESHIVEKLCRNMEVFTCETCKSTYTDFNVLKKHIAEHLGKPLLCLTCNQCFSTEKLLKSHNCVLVKSKLHVVNERDSCSSVQKCTYCGKLFRNKHQCKKLKLKLHEDGEKNMESSKKKFTGKLKFTKRSNEFKKVQRLKYKCGNCEKVFIKLSKLHIHILNTHHAAAYDCEKCNLKFLNQEDRDIHLKGCKGEEPCSCKICGKIFAKKDYLKKHEYIHSNALHRCKFCHCAFMKEKSYKKHIERMNCSKSARKIRLSQFNYKKCRICSRDFNEEEMLIQHFNADHHGENPHQCFCCESYLPTFKDLENHIHLHNIQKYTCGLCGKPYTSQEGFRKHRLKHKGAEFKCQFCDSEFLNERRFKFHVKSCKKNPENAYHHVQQKVEQEKDGKPKQSRQLHWESRIIMKRLRGDPNSGNNKLQTNQWRSFDSVANFFDEPNSDSNDSNVRGWFDDYYKTEEDDFAFGLKRENTDKNNENVPVTQKCQMQDITKTSDGSGAFIPDGNDVDSNENFSNFSSDTSSEEEDFPEELPLDYNPKKCRICLITFSQEYELLHHFIKLHPKKKAHKCPKCDEECPLFAQLKEHMKTHGIGIGIYNCVNCSKRFRNEKKMKTHTIRCKGVDTEAALNEEANKKFQFIVDKEDYCRRCCKTFQTKCGYRRHKHVCKERRKSNKENKKTADTTSGYISSDALTTPEDDSPPSPEKQTADTASPLQPKTNVVNTSDPVSKTYAGEPPMDSFPCRLCDKKFQYERGIVMHFKSDHPGHKPLVCHICNMHLADKLKEHLKTHGIGEEFICELCGKRFNQKFLSKIHEMWHQGVEYKCGNCKQKFLNKEKMDKHINEGRCSNRQSLMRLPCDICGKSYRSKFGLSKHYITHTPKELRPVKNRMNCEFCGKWFETNNGLQRHRRIHTGERPFCCRFCSKSFVQEGNCKSHERIHTGEPRPRKKKKITWEGVTSCS